MKSLEKPKCGLQEFCSTSKAPATIYTVVRKLLPKITPSEVFPFTSFLPPNIINLRARPFE